MTRSSISKARISDKVVGCGFFPKILLKSNLIEMNHGPIAVIEQVSSINTTSIEMIPSYIMKCVTFSFQNVF